MNTIRTIITNKYIYIPLMLWFIIQLYKVMYDLITTKKFNFKRILGAGGMPSSHSAVVVSLAPCTLPPGRRERPLSLLLSVFLAVMYDAAGIRRAAGKQAKLLNKIIETPGLSTIEVQGKLVEVLGHTPVQVFVGAAIGVIVGLLA